MNCAVCGAAQPRAKLEKDGVSIRECAECSLAWWEPPPGFRPADTYDAGYFADSGASHGYDDYESLETSLRRNFARRLARLPAPERGARLLDVGAAYGYAISEAGRAGYRACGVEVSAAAARRAAEVTGGRVVVGDVGAAPFPQGVFDVVTMWDVLEHLPDPHESIAAAAALLRPGGRLVLTTGDVGSLLARLSGARWHLYTIPEHLFFYSRESLHRLVSAHAFRVDSIRADTSLYTLGYLVERLRKTLLGRKVASSHGWPGARLAIPVNLFDVVTLTAVRAG